MTAAAAQHDRAAILNRVAEAIWHAPEVKPDQVWGRALMLASGHCDPALTYRVESTLAEARAAVAALMIGTSGRTEDVRLAMAGEHATGIVGGLCVEAFDAMLTEILE